MMNVPNVLGICKGVWCRDCDAHRKALAVNFEDENLISTSESHFVFDLQS
jgi:hypothetical protein